MSQLKSVLFVVIMAWAISSHAENCGNHHASPESYDFSRQQDCRLAQESNKEVKVTLNTLVLVLKANSITGDAEHDAQGIERLLGEHQSWLNYRNDHCGVQAHLHVYPAGSRLSDQEYHKCVTKQNLERIKFLSDMNLEFTQ